ncbi:hypothetical protein tloyanaT_14100 [Thalassotalea loyana]|uniref:Lipoprotein n=1 Tax=Thalassotalea loyana TaxID=280483 RepID=A0ABQ6HAK7_9GAMM|nr:hypothetical protein [Thalassotalea loyana]GLX85158.1 hypothetical protein tloyanaT_14100 [Thalassotalea loyana]
MVRLIVSILSVVLLSSCAGNYLSATCTDPDKCESAIISKTVQRNDKVSAGVLYALPRQRVKITIKSELVTKEGIKQTITKRYAEVDKSKAKLIQATKEKKSAEDRLAAHKNAEDIGESYETYASRVAIEIFEAKAIIKVETDKISALNKQIVKLKNQLTSFPDTPAIHTISMTPVAEAPHADGDAMLSAVMVDNPKTADSFEITTTDAGLLSGGSGTSKGQVDEIIVSLAKAIGAFNAPTTTVNKNAPIGSHSFVAAKGLCKHKAFNKTFVLDFKHSDAPEAEINRFFKTNKLCLKFNINNSSSFTSDYSLLTYDIKAEDEAGTEDDDKGLYDGLVYPRKSALNMSLCETINTDVQQCSPMASFPTQYFSLDIIDPSRVGVIKLDQGTFADNNYEFEFSNGLLTRFKSDKPSEIISALAMIPAAAKALVEIPAEIIQLKFDLSDKDRAYYEMQTAILKAKLEHDAISENQEQYQQNIEDEILGTGDTTDGDDNN